LLRAVCPVFIWSGRPVRGAVVPIGSSFPRGEMAIEALVLEGAPAKHLPRRPERLDELQCGSQMSPEAKETEMPANDIVRARIDRRIKEEAAAILAAAGLTISDAFRMMLMRTVADKALPFDPLVPNADTIEAMKAARRGDLVTVGGVDDLMADLHEDD
jgi:DNA-damage-inducible protein J